jgi:hypothetical protein
VANDPDSGVIIVLGEDLARIVPATVVDDHEVDVRIRLPQDTVDGSWDESGPIVGCDNDRDRRTVRTM